MHPIDDLAPASLRIILAVAIFYLLIVAAAQWPSVKRWWTWRKIDRRLARRRPHDFR